MDLATPAPVVPDTNAQNVIASVLAKHNVAAPKAAPVLAQPKPAAPAIPAPEDTKAS